MGGCGASEEIAVSDWKYSTNIFGKVVTRDYGALQPTLEGMKTSG
jgi:hypothetical protein